MNHFNLQADTSAFGRYTHALITQHKNRSRCFERGYSVEQCERVDHKLQWLLKCFSISPLCIAQANTLTSLPNIKLPEHLFSYLCIALQTNTETLVTELLSIYCKPGYFDNADMNTALVDTLVFCNAAKHPTLWKLILQSVDASLAIQIKQRVALYVTETDRREWLPVQHDVLSQIQLGASGPLDALNWLQSFQGFEINGTQFFYLEWASNRPNEKGWAELQSLELEKPNEVFKVYQLWGGREALIRIVNGLQSPRLNEAAYKAWLFLTQQPLPLAPTLQDSATGQTANDQQYACAESAQQFLATVSWFNQSLPQQRLNHIHCLINALTTSVSRLDDAIWLALLTQLKQESSLPLIQSKLFSERQPMLLSIKDTLATSYTHEY